MDICKPLGFFFISQTRRRRKTNKQKKKQTMNFAWSEFGAFLRLSTLSWLKLTSLCRGCEASPWQIRRIKRRKYTVMTRQKEKRRKKNRWLFPSTHLKRLKLSIQNYSHKDKLGKESKRVKHYTWKASPYPKHAYPQRLRKSQNPPLQILKWRREKKKERNQGDE